MAMICNTNGKCSQGWISPEEPGTTSPNDPDIFEITNLENALQDLVSKRNSLLNEQSRELKMYIYSAHFLFDCLKELNPGSVLNTSPDIFQKRAFECRYDAFNEQTVLQERIRKANIYRSTVKAKFELSLSTKVLSFQGVKGGLGHTLLYRVQVLHESPTWSTTTPTPSLQPSACEERRLGICCSAWDAFGEITNEAIISHMNGDKVKNHMNGKEEGTPMISVSESPGRLMKHLNKPLWRGDGHATVIYAISLRMLQQIGVLQARSTELCDDRGVQRVNGYSQEGSARYTTLTHWVVVHWIPHEAVVALMTPNEFLELAKNRGVIGDVQRRNLLDTNDSIRFDVWDFPNISLMKPLPQVQDEVPQLTALTQNLGLYSGNTR